MSGIGKIGKSDEMSGVGRYCYGAIEGVILTWIVQGATVDGQYPCPDLRMVGGITLPQTTDHADPHYIAR